MTQPISPAASDAGSILVACATETGALIDGHFGSCDRFLIYRVSRARAELVEVRTVDPAAEAAAEKNVHRADLIRDCRVVCVSAIGGPAAAKVVRRDVHPVRVPHPVAAAEMVERLRVRLETAPPRWLAKAMAAAEGAPA